ncbi:hypothetical protein T492DRAFT_999581 [Pavlovales sp. CCMP2436]|nr:hypothetical protein T492DRAFT_999581 [Pavlovales sp. CCMP2436]|mmetsp:Transcript_15548/g.39523  ORF Transcript_15548/g.39523 Transcript_15548/m.39523 type:complete len:310 (+) Transcript_15548:59-988(+)
MAIGSQRMDRAIILATTLIAVGMLVGATYLRAVHATDYRLDGAELRPPATGAAFVAALGLYAPDVQVELSTVAAGAPTVVAAAAAGDAEHDGAPVAVVSTSDDDVSSFERALDERAAPLGGDLSCHGRRGYDISGDSAFVWGLTFHVKSEVECCRACAAHRTICSLDESVGKPFWTNSQTPQGKAQVSKCGRNPARLCNAFVYCPEERCFSYTPHNHSRHECWLKHEPNVTHPIAHGTDFPPEMRNAPRKNWPWAVSNVTWPGPPPLRVQWIAGLVLPRGEPVWVQPQMPSWFRSFCGGKFGPCTRLAS